jgi:hypothetical protein
VARVLASWCRKVIRNEVSEIYPSILNTDIKSKNGIFDYLGAKTTYRFKGTETSIELDFEWDVESDTRVTLSLKDEWEHLWSVIKEHLPKHHGYHLSIGGGGDSKVGEFLNTELDLWAVVNPNKTELEKLKNPYRLKTIKIRAIGEELPIKSNTFNCVDILGTIDHLIDPISTLREIHRILKPDSEVLITVTNSKSWYKRVFESLGISHSNSHSHAHNFDSNSLSELLEKTGFEIVNLFSTQYLRLPIIIEKNLRQKKLRIARHFISNTFLPMVFGKKSGGIIVCKARAVK